MDKKREFEAAEKIIAELRLYRDCRLENTSRKLFVQGVHGHSEGMVQKWIGHLIDAGILNKNADSTAFWLTSEFTEGTTWRNILKASIGKEPTAAGRRREEILKLKKQIEKFQDESNSIRGQNLSLKTTNVELERDYSLLAVEANGSRAKIASLERDKFALQGQIAKLNQTISTLREKIERATASAEQLVQSAIAT